jgi:hypothetical protein
MYTTTTSTILLTLSTLLLSTLTHAAPSNPLAARDNSITVTFIGAAGAQFTQPIPFTSTFTPITNGDLSVSHIATSGGPVACFGIDGSINKFPAAGYADVGPPQVIVGCVAGPIPEGARH